MTTTGNVAVEGLHEGLQPPIWSFAERVRGGGRACSSLVCAEIGSGYSAANDFGPSGDHGIGIDTSIR